MTQPTEITEIIDDCRIFKLPMEQKDVYKKIIKSVFVLYNAFDYNHV